jgi:NADH-quinone oxidoreductase subunit E
MSISLSEKSARRFEKLQALYPDQRALLLPMLYLVQEDQRWISPEAIRFVADRLGLSPAYVNSVATFYTMFNTRPVGRYHFQVCTNISCSLLGATHIVDYLKRKLQLKFGETSADGRYTLTEVECLGSCGTAPMMQINDTYYENLTEATIDQILSELAT